MLGKLCFKMSILGNRRSTTNGLGSSAALNHRALCLNTKTEVFRRLFQTRALEITLHRVCDS